MRNPGRGAGTAAGLAKAPIGILAITHEIQSDSVKRRGDLISAGPMEGPPLCGFVKPGVVPAPRGRLPLFENL